MHGEHVILRDLESGELALAVVTSSYKPLQVSSSPPGAPGARAFRSPPRAHRCRSIDWQLRVIVLCCLRARRGSLARGGWLGWNPVFLSSSSSCLSVSSCVPHPKTKSEFVPMSLKGQAQELIYDLRGLAVFSTHTKDRDHPRMD